MSGVAGKPESPLPGSRPRLLYLGFAFPPGVQHLHPGVNPAGHSFETQLAQGLANRFEVRSVGLLPFNVGLDSDGTALSPGLSHSLVLVEKPPELLSRWKALRQLRRSTANWRRQGWVPDALLVCNLSPVYNAFLRSLAQPVPARVLLLADSPVLGRKLPWLKRARRRLKPLMFADEAMLPFVDACVGLSRNTERFFSARGIPWCWMPGACAPEQAVGDAEEPATGPVRFGYFGSLAPHNGIQLLLDAFASLPGTATLNLSGYGKQSEAIAARCRNNPRVRFHGLLPTPADCRRLAQNCDVLVNPRPRLPGNENSFPSKIFDYALCGRAILTTGFAGVREVLGPQAFYLDEGGLAASLSRELIALSARPRTELWQRGREMQRQILADYSWPVQAARVAQFIEQFIPGSARAA